jgi:Skp family chaperone for outer membrane proteins
MIRCYKVSILFIIFLLGFSLNANSEEKIAILNMEFLMEKSLAGKSIKKQLEDIRKKDIEIFKKKETQIKEEDKKLIAQKNVLSAEDFKKKINELREKFRKYNNEKLEKMNLLNNKKNSSIKTLIKEINPILKEFANVNKITIIIDKRYAILVKNELDITEDVLKILDKKIKKINLK